MKPLLMSTKLKARELCVLSLMGALMFAQQIALASIPNIHLTAVLIILTAVFFGWRCLYSVGVFIFLEGLIWGFGPWWLCYLYLWPALAIPAVLMRRNDSPIIWAIIAAVHGLSFGALYALPYLVIGGWSMAFSTWVAGIPFDLTHCAGNFVLTGLLYRPLKTTMLLALRQRAQ